ncbi:SpaH/EbpB family LPXTG-anchored major pilin [Streptococcus suis]|uniref:SpaH/EbpB family LPXTG-anchored major pilin n=1 Tax=Streptococcus suis TaxID=1307 RepID=UPI002118320E|nr:SpaH/EbpB family LPXTG-anchored major pilin [Streptococcus suis]
MKALRKIFMVVMSLLLAFGPLLTSANDVVPESTTITIHKLSAGSTKPAEDALKTNADGSEIQLDSLGFPVTPMAGIKFQWFKVGDTETVEELSAKTLEQLRTTYTTNGITDATGTDGTTNVVVSKSNYGRYWIVELSKGDASEANKAMQVTKTVPMLVTLPFGTETGYQSTIHLYPKNVTETPTPGKDVAEVGNNSTGQNVGDTVKWFLKGTIPVDIRNYTKYGFKDVLSEALDYSAVQNVKVGDQVLTVNTDYTVTYTEDTRTLLVYLTPAGIAKLADYRDAHPDADYATSAEVQDAVAPKVFVSVELDTVLNEKAVPGKPITNKTTIVYDNPYDPDGDEEETPPSDEPKVYSGGKKFKKVEGSEQTPGKSLAGAEFGLFTNQEATTAVLWTQEMIEANKATTDNAGKFKNPQVGQPVVLVSDADGTFEIQGLAYGDNGSDEATAERTYYLKETKAPEGFILPANPIVSFVVNKTSYYQDPTATDLVPAEPTNVFNNKKPELPLTGGIGATLFIVSGLAMMAFAAYKLKNRKA